MKLFEIDEVSPTTGGGELFSYIVWWIKNPDEGSSFDKKTRYIRWLPGSVLLWLLVQKHYGGFLFMDDRCSQVIGHVFFQRHGDAVHLFSMATRREMRGFGLGTDMIRESLLHVYADTSVNHVRIGAGGHPAVDKIWRKVVEGRLGLPFKVEPDEKVGWAHFVR